MGSRKQSIADLLIKYKIASKIKRVGLLSLLDFSLNYLLTLLSNWVYKPGNRNFSLKEVLFFRRNIDVWNRQSRVLDELNKLTILGNCLILDLGTGNRGIINCLKPEKKFSVVSLDMNKSAIKNLDAPNRIVGDGCNLPFTDKSFDYVTSIDVIEHIPKTNRRKLFSELKRVCIETVFLTCPLQSVDGKFQGEKFDYIFQRMFEREYGFKEYNTEEHIKSKHPTMEELKQAFPNIELTAYNNCETWLKYMLFSRKPVVGLFSGFLYHFFWSKKDDKAPFWGAIIKAKVTEEEKTIVKRICFQYSK